MTFVRKQQNVTSGVYGVIAFDGAVLRGTHFKLWDGVRLIASYNATNDYDRYTLPLPAGYYKLVVENGSVACERCQITDHTSRTANPTSPGTYALECYYAGVPITPDVRTNFQKASILLPMTALRAVNDMPEAQLSFSKVTSLMLYAGFAGTSYFRGFKVASGDDSSQLTENLRFRSAPASTYLHLALQFTKPQSVLISCEDDGGTPPPYFYFMWTVVNYVSSL